MEEHNNTPMPIEDALSFVVRQQGCEILCDGGKLKAFLSDLAPNDKEMTDILSDAAKHHFLDGLANCDEEHFDTAIDKAVTLAESLYAKSVVDNLKTVLVHALNIPQTDEKTVTSQKKTLQQNTSQTNSIPVKKRSGMKKILIALLVILLAGAGTAGFMTIRKSMRMQQLIQKGDNLVTLHQYRSAISYYKDADNLGASVSSKICDAYMQYGEYTTEQGNYESAIDVYHQFMQSGYYVQQYDVSGAIYDTYLAWANQLLEDNNPDEAIGILKEAENEYPGTDDIYNLIVDSYCALAEKYISEVDYLTARVIMEDQKAEYPNETRFDDVLEEIDSAINKDDTLRKLDAIRTLLDEDKTDKAIQQMEGLKNFVSEINLDYPLILPISGDKKIGLYNPKSDIYSVYYGTYNDQIREGEGIYLYWNTFSKSNDYDYFIGQWKNDKPNGKQAEYYTYYVDGVKNRDEVTEYNAVDGIWDGDVTRTNNLNGMVYKGSFTDGIANVIETITEDDGTERKVFLMTDDEKYFYYFNNDISYSTKLGISGFYEQ